jgi:hypothetical protein
LPKTATFKVLVQNTPYSGGYGATRFFNLTIFF